MGWSIWQGPLANANHQVSRPTRHLSESNLGNSAGRPLAEVWEVLLMGSDSPAPAQVQGEQEFGIRWDGEYEALSRLIFGLGTRFEEAAEKGGLSREQAAKLREKLAPELFELLFVEAMPVQDAVAAE